MKLIAVVLITTSMLLTAVSAGFSLTTTGSKRRSLTRSGLAVRRATWRAHSARVTIRR
jgi:hypothetical protein